MARIWAVTRSASLGEARGVLDDAADRGAVERQQALAPRHRGDEPRVLRGRLVVAHELVVEVGGDLEELVEVGVALRQQRSRAGGPP